MDRLFNFVGLAVMSSLGSFYLYVGYNYYLLNY